MASEQFYALWVNRNGQHLWEGPFAVEGIAWGHLQMIIDAQKGFVVRGTQMSNTAPQPGSGATRASQPAGNDTEYGPWFTTTFDSDCGGTCGEEIIEGDLARSNGRGGCLCRDCGDK